jgi:hypothetical protein
MRPVQEVVAVAKRCFRVLIDRNDDGLDMGITMAFTRRPMADFGERSDPGGIVSGLVVPARRLAQHRSPFLNRAASVGQKFLAR